MRGRLRQRRYPVAKRERAARFSGSASQSATVIASGIASGIVSGRMALVMGGHGFYNGVVGKEVSLLLVRIFSGAAVGAAVVAAAFLIACGRMIRRIVNPVMRLISSRSQS